MILKHQLEFNCMSLYDPFCLVLTLSVDGILLDKNNMEPKQEFITKRRLVLLWFLMYSALQLMMVL